MKHFKIYLFLLAIASAMFFISCEKDDPVGPNPPPPTDKPLTSAIIGPEGGKLDAGDMELVIPEGSLQNKVEIELAKVQKGVIFDDNEASGFYKVVGLPTNFSKAITISLTPESGSGYDHDMVMSHPGVAMSAQDEIVSTSFVESVVIAGEYIYELKPLINDSESSLKTIDLSFGLVKNIVKTLSVKPPRSQKHRFAIYADRGLSSQASELKEYLEAAYDKLLDMGFSYDERTSWPIGITLKKFPKKYENVFGFFIQSKWSRNYSRLEFNSDKLSQKSDMKATAGHEFFHFVQSLYNPSGYISTWWNNHPFLWLDEASSVWFEGRMVPDYASSVRIANALKPFDGIYTGPKSNAQEYGYGMSSFIQYISKTYGDEKIVEVYKAIAGKAKDPVAALKTGAGKRVQAMYIDFLRNYLEGKVYKDLFVGVLFSKNLAKGIGNANVFKIETESDTLREYENTLPGLAAKRYAVRLDYEEFADGDQLVITSKLPTIVYAYKYIQGEKPELLFYGREKQTIPNLKKLQEEGASISILHANTEVADKSSKLKIQVQKPKYNFSILGENFNLKIRYLYKGKVETTTVIAGMELEGPVPLAYNDGFYEVSGLGWDDDENYKFKLDFKNKKLLLAEQSDKCLKMEFKNVPASSWAEDKMVFELRGKTIGNYFSFKNIGQFGYVSDGRCNDVVSATFGNDALLRIVFTK